MKKARKIINTWKRNSIKFTQYSILEENNLLNKSKEIYLREYKVFYTYDEKNSKVKLNKYVIWIDELNLSHIRQSKHIFIDGTWYWSNGYEQILIILYKDIIINEKIPGIFAIMNNKKYEIYKGILSCIYDLITQNNLYMINIESITSDA